MFKTQLFIYQNLSKEISLLLISKWEFTRKRRPFLEQSSLSIEKTIYKILQRYLKSGY